MRRRFTSEQTANKFAKVVDGKVNDLRNIQGAKSRFTVTYKQSEKTRSYLNEDDSDEEISADYYLHDSSDL